MNTYQTERKHERGNVIFYIFLGIVLIAALSFAVSDSMRGGTGQVDAETARVHATEIVEYANVMSSAVAQLRLRGVTDAELCFDHPSWGANNYDHSPSCTDDANRIFDLDGGGLQWSRPPSEAMDSSASPDNLWHIYGDNEIENVGTTCGAASCSDLILVADELSLSVCQAINTLLGVQNPGGNPPTDSDLSETRYIGAYAYASTIGDETTALIGQKAACYRNTGANEYVFYKVLVAR